MAEPRLVGPRGEAVRASSAPAARGGSAAGAAGRAAPVVVDVDVSTFEAEVLRRSLEVPVLVDLWAPWCGPCRTLSPILERLANESPGRFVLAKVEIDSNPEIAQAFGVRSVPTVVAIVRGRPVDAFTGALPEPEVRRFLDRVAPARRGAGPTAAEETGEALLAAGRLDEARARFARDLERRPDDVGALLGLARTAALLGRAAEAEGYLKGLPPAHDEAPAAEAVRTVLALRAEDSTAGRALASGDVRAACEALLDEVRRSRGAPASRAPGDAARERLVALFRVLGDRAPLVEEFRDRLAKILF